MSITPREWKELTESEYWRPEEGTQYNVVMTGWRFERRAYQEYGRDDPSSEKRPTIVMNVVEINGEAQDPPKEFSSSNKALNRLLYQAVVLSEQQGRTYVKLRLFRIDKRNYNVVDLANVDNIVHGKVLPPRTGAY